MSTGTNAMKVIWAVSAEPSETESACSGLYRCIPAIHVLGKFPAAQKRTLKKDLHERKTQPEKEFYIDSITENSLHAETKTL